MMPRDYEDRAVELPGSDEGEGGLALPAFVLDPFGVVKRRWPWMLVACVVGLAATAVVAVAWKPMYVARATVLITSQQIPEDFVRSTVREDSIESINTMVARVLSQESIDRLIEQFDLDDGLGDETSRIKLIRRTLSKIGVAPVKAARRSRRGSPGSLVYELSFESEIPSRAAIVANALAARFTEESIEQRNAQARRTTEFLRRELMRDEKELRVQSQKISELRQLHRGHLPEELGTNLSKLERLSQRRQSLATQIAEKESQILTISSAPSGLEQSPDEVLLEEARSQLSRELAVHTEEHPNVAALQRRVERLEELVAQEDPLAGPNSEIRHLLAAEQRHLELLRTQLAQADAEIEELGALVDRTPAVGEELAALEQGMQVQREDYLGSLRKVEEAELAESLEMEQQGAQVSVLDSAKKPTSPELPRWIVLVVGLGATLAFAVGLAVLFELLDPVIVIARQLESIAERPALGAVPQIS